MPKGSLLTKSALEHACLTFKAGQLLTSDPVVLDAIKHYRIEFVAHRPEQVKMPKQIAFSPREIEVIESEIFKYISKQIIEPTSACSGSFVSNIFTRPKKDGSYRMILNLKPLNEFIDYHHFKMDTFNIAIKLVKPGCFMASIDLKDAYILLHSCSKRGEEISYVSVERNIIPVHLFA